MPISRAVLTLLLAALTCAPSLAAPFAVCPPADPLARLFAAAGGGPVARPACGSYCDHTGPGTTPTATAIGSSCTAAQSNLSAQLKSYSNGQCPTRSCGLIITTTIACHAASGGFSVSGYAKFGCEDSTC